MGRAISRTGRRRVALLVETSNAYGRGLLEGIGDFVREQRRWSVFIHERSRSDEIPATLRRWKGDGLIARIESERIARWIDRLGVPTVDVGSRRLRPDLPWVETDDVAIAELAVEHLLERGLRSFGYVGDARFAWSARRREAFLRAVARAGGTAQTFEASAHAGRASWERRQRDLARWARQLPPGTGVLACYDMMATRLLDACRSVDVAVPEEVAVVGVDDDPLLCGLAQPALTSIAPDARRAGHQAAALLDRAMAGARKTVTLRIPPRGLVTRESSDILAVGDRHVADALRFIREHACDRISVGDVLARSPLSRRVLELRFRKVLGRSPHEELLRARLNQVKSLLAGTDLSIAEIADRIGYAHAEYLSAQFAREVGVPPSRYRARLRTATAARRVTA